MTKEDLVSSNLQVHQTFTVRPAVSQQGAIGFTERYADSA
jgi:hypothetical protein